MVCEAKSKRLFAKNFWDKDMSHVGVAELRLRQCAKATRLGTGRMGFDLGSATSLAHVLERITQPLTARLDVAICRVDILSQAVTFVCLFAACVLLTPSLAVFFHCLLKDSLGRQLHRCLRI